MSTRRIGGDVLRRLSRLAVVLALAGPAACASVDSIDPLAPVPTNVDPRDVEPPALRVQWSIEADLDDDDDADPPSHSPALGDRLVYVPYGEELRAHAAADGRLLWTARLGEPLALRPIPMGETVALATGSRWLWLDEGGRTVGTLEISAAPRDAQAIPGALVWVDAEAVRAARPAESGTADSAPVAGSHGLAWSRSLTGALTITPGGDTLFVRTDDGGLHAMRAATGSAVWARTDLDITVARPAIGDRHVYVVGSSTRAIALSRTDGRSRWTSNPIGVEVVAAPSFVENIVWIAGLDAALNGFDANGGSHFFRVPLPGRSYVDLAHWERWLIASPQYGPWSIIRGPLRSGGPGNPGSPRGYPISSTGDLELAPGIGRIGAVVADASGRVYLLTPPPTRAARSTGEAW